MRKVYIDRSPGTSCDEAGLDTQRLINLVGISRNDFIYTNSLEQADLIVIHACGHLESHEKDSISTIKRIMDMRKASSELVVWGCLSKINPASLRNVYKGPIIGPEDWDFFYTLFGLPEAKLGDLHANTTNIHDERIEPEVRLRERTVSFLEGGFELSLGRKKITVEKTWYIKIVNGCMNCCTFCSDRLAYRRFHSEPIESIVEQFRLGLEKGYNHFYLVGRDLGSYGRDIGLTLPRLLDEIIGRYPHHQYKLALHNVSPRSLIDMHQELDLLLSSGKISELGSHIQSGSNRVLKLMGRPFSRSKWLAIIKSIERSHPEIYLLTSIMVGFPTETARDFQDSVDLLNQTAFDQVMVYSYNERPNLPSLKLGGPIAEETKMKRYHRMRYHAKLCEIRRRIRRGHAFLPFTLMKWLVAYYHLALSVRRARTMHTKRNLVLTTN